MVDKLHDINEEFVETSFAIPEDCIFVEHGFFNEFGLIENAAQTCSSIVGKSYFSDHDVHGTGTKLIGFISAIKKVTVFKTPQVGKIIYTKAYLKSRFDTDGYSISTLNCDIFESDQKLLACELNLFIRELE
ncbi:Rho GTPase-activating protein [Algoriphagus chordae]|uniref:Uncharacterized protein n=1 Tax=Algoriphagus chordae TaxID=237019 RepID=A0A2W7R3R7_9BACT|nr:ABC transporter permease [Algoriphagus chordae]PZX48729.1 hypothetical protein LV85_03544 [Algoriphagus chordae]